MAEVESSQWVGIGGRDRDEVKEDEAVEGLQNEVAGLAGGAVSGGNVEDMHRAT